MLHLLITHKRKMIELFREKAANRQQPYESLRQHVLAHNVILYSNWPERWRIVHKAIKSYGRWKRIRKVLPSTNEICIRLIALRGISFLQEYQFYCKVSCDLLCTSKSPIRAPFSQSCQKRTHRQTCRSPIKRSELTSIPTPLLSSRSSTFLHVGLVVDTKDIRQKIGGHKTK